jgi:hypothetical protein
VLATFAFGGATWGTPWRIIAQRTAVGVVFSSACVALCAIVLPRLVPVARRRFPFPFDWVVVTASLVGVAMLGCAAGVLVLAAAGYVSVDRMWPTWTASVRTATYFTILFGIMARSSMNWRADSIERRS